ncbi:MAG: hypothetical protein FJ320_10850 [SAR202 cluster bacterium]|nr:hypothetical protein [SAR202 cluster bacterium]
MQKSFVLKVARPDSAAFQYGGLSLACELISAQIIQLLGLKSPSYAIVNIEQEFADSVPSRVHQLFNDNIGPQFGCEYLEEAVDFIPGRRLDDEDALSALEGVISFDAMIWNQDRTQLKPNLLVKANEFYLIDHSTVMPVGLILSGGEFLTEDQITNNCAYATLYYKRRLYQALVEKWADEVTLGAIEQIAGFVPNEWITTRSRFNLMLKFLRERHTFSAQIIENLKDLVH